MSSTNHGPNAGTEAGDAVKKGWGLVHGAGEALRGTANSFADEVTNKGTATDAAAQTKNQNIAERGVDEMEHGHYHGTGAGVTPADTSREKVNRTIQGER